MVTVDANMPGLQVRGLTTLWWRIIQSEVYTDESTGIASRNYCGIQKERWGSRDSLASIGLALLDPSPFGLPPASGPLLCPSHRLCIPLYAAFTVVGHIRRL